MKTPLEIEFKYHAGMISLEKFKAFCLDREPVKTIIASGFDYFYANEKDSNAFCRLRVGADINQLTFKRKTKDANNFVRTEHNVELSKDMTIEQIQSFVSEFGYKPDATIFKNCFVYKYNYYTLVYYICYDTNMTEQGRYVEIEMAEEYPWRNEKEAYEGLLSLERLCKPLGIAPQGRIKRSLFELYGNAK